MDLATAWLVERKILLPGVSVLERLVARVHVEHGDGSAKYWLEPVSLSSSRGLNRARLVRCEEIVDENVELFLKRWKEYFG